jgi:subtilisin family serine protease
MDKRTAILGATTILAAAVVSAPVPVAAEPVSGYVVVLRQTGQQAEALAQRVGGRADHVYDAALSGFSARLSQSQARSLARDPAVSYVVPDTPVRALGEQPNPPSWGLDRIDQRALPLDQLYRFANTADNVNAYVIDTGIRATHGDLAGRVSGGVDIVDNDNNPDDGNGHGTFVAGIIGGTQFGVAKRIHLVPVRVLNNSGAGTIANVIAGVDWVARNARKPAVVNMSLGGQANQALDDAVRAAIASGVTFVVASGSSASDAGNFSPARVREAITTSATRIDDCVFPPSNFGPLIDLYAPGANITSDWITSDTATITLSGTSWSTPHVVGGAALFLATNPAATPAQVASALITRSTKGVLCNVPANTANRLLYTGP